MFFHTFLSHRLCLYQAYYADIKGKTSVFSLLIYYKFLEWQNQIAITSILKRDNSPIAR